MTFASLNRSIFAAILFIAPMSVTPWNKIALVGLFVLSTLLIAFMLAAEGRLSTSLMPLTLLAIYLAIFAIGFISLLINSSDTFGISIGAENLGRLFSISTLALVLIAGFAFINNADHKEMQQLAKYWLFPGAVLVLLGGYQVYCNFTGKAFFIETRDWMHGVPMALRDAVPKRVTSVAEEPSFVAPLFIEFFLIASFLVKQKLKRYLAMLSVFFVFLLTFSGGGYVNAALLAGCAFVVLMWKFPLGKLHFFILLVMLVALVILFTVGGVFVEFAINKFTTESTGGSARGRFMSDLLSIQLAASPIDLLLGHGLTSLSQLEEFGMRSEDALFRISNNMLIDILWESGMLGASLALLLFLVLFKQSWMLQSKMRGQMSLSLLLVCQMAITSLYRSEYISSHFVWMLLLVVWAIKWERETVEGATYKASACEKY